MRNLFKIQGLFSARLLSALLFSVTLAFQAQAGIDPQLSRIETPANGTPLSLLDIDGIKTAVSSNAPIGLSPDKIHNRITMYTNPNYTVFFGTAMDIEVTMDVKKYTYASDVTPAQTESIVLTIKYDPFSGTQYIHSQGVRDFGFRKMEIELTDIKVDNVSQDELPALVIIDAEILSLKHTQFNYPANLNLAYEPENVGCVDKPTNLKISWADASNDGAIEYQLEWLHVNDYGPVDYSGSTPQATFLNPNQLNYNFKYNSTRITTTETSYDLSLIFDRGYVLFRVRAVGIDLNGNYLFGPWTPVSQEGTVDLYPSTNRYRIEESASHEQLLNWQYAATYAEEGKRKEVISYFDGSLRNRQTVTRINSDENVIVGETIYDHQGRPAITVLPAPVPLCENNSPVIQFYPNFNRNEDENPYSRLDFDTDQNGELICDLQAQGMSTSSGAANYYSNFNTDQVGSQAYVPTAQVAIDDPIAFPFVQVEYTPDNTGRIRRQGGVGPDYQMGSGHETEYIYSAPNQVELDRLFGSEVGYAQHYKKNTVVDAHGQASISYLDQEGRVIATALAGNAPDNLEAISSEENAQASLTVNAFQGAGTNQVYYLAEKIVFSQELGVSFDAEYTFNYRLELTPSQISCDDICFDCVYDLKFELLDECGVDMFALHGSAVPTMVGRFSQNAQTGDITFHGECTSGTYVFTNNQVEIPLTVGSYSFNKILTVNQAAKQAFIEAYLASACVTPFQEFLDDALDLVDFSDCEVDCEKCLEELGTVADYISQGGSIHDYNEQYAICQQLCNDGDPYSFCENAFRIMVMDMMPNGQYGKVYNNAGQIVSNAHPLSVYNPNNLLPGFNSENAFWQNPIYFDRATGNMHEAYFEANGDSARVTVALVNGVFSPAVVDPNDNVHFNASTNTFYTYPQHLSNLEDFVSYCTYDWAKSLVHHHPEYCSYRTCVDVEDYKQTNDFYTSSTFDDLLLKTTTFQGALDAGLIVSPYQSSGYYNPSAIKWTVDNNSPITETAPRDPYAVYAGTLNSQIGDNVCQVGALSGTAGKFTQYQQINGVWRSMPEVAAYMARCSDNYWSSPSLGCFNFGGPAPAGYPGTLTELQDKEWEYLKSFYLSEKQQMLTRFLDCASGKICDSYTGCIGNSDFNPMASYVSSTSGGIFANGFFNPDQPCGIINYEMYGSLERRFPRVVDVVPAPTPNEVAYNVYLQTGQCPVEFVLQNFLTELADNNKLHIAFNNLNQIGSLNSMFQANNNFNMPGTIPQFNQTVSTSGNTLTMNWIDVSTSTVYNTITLTQTGTLIPWAQITQFLNLSATSSTNFTIQGFTSNNAPVNMTGTISSVFNLSSCSFNSVGTQNAIGSDIQFLLNAMAASSNLTNTSGVLVTPLTVSGNTYNVVGDNLQNLIQNGLALSWRQTSAWNYELGNSSNCRKLRIKFTNPPAINPANITMFSNLVSNGQHTFTVTAHIGTLTYNLTGTVILDNCGTNQGIAVGNFDLPTPVLCQSNEHAAFENLVDVIEYTLLYNDVTQSINIFQNPYLAQPLLNQLYDGVMSTSTINAGLNSMTFHIINANNDTTCLIHVENLGGVAQLNQVTSIQSATTYGSVNNFNNYQELLLGVTFNNVNEPDGKILVTATCLNLQSCEPCPEAFEFDMEMEHEAFLSAKIASGGIELDDSYEKYTTYAEKIDLYNQENNLSSSDSLFITKISYAEFVDKGHHLPSSSFVRYIEEMRQEIDDEVYLRSPDKFAVEHGAGTNVLFEYERYKKAVTLYNERATSASLSAISPLTAEEFAHARLARQHQIYVDYIQMMPQGQIPAQDILSFFEIDSISNENDNQVLYSLYVDAYLSFIADSANFDNICARVEVIPAMFAYEDLDEAYLFCSENAKSLVYDYIDQLENRCVGELPILRVCDTEKSHNDYEQQKFFVYYLTKLEEFNQTAWAVENEFFLESTYKNYVEFWEDMQRETIMAYTEHLDSYKTYVANSGEQRGEPAAMISFKPSSGRIPKDEPCKRAYTSYFNCWNNFRNFFFANWASLPQFQGYQLIRYTEAEFTKLNYCHCVDEFCAQLQALMDGLTPPTVSNVSAVLSMRFLCKEPCTPDINPQVPIQSFEIPEEEIVDDCYEMLYNQAYFAAQNNYEIYLQGLVGEISQMYSQHCYGTGVSETLTYTYTDKQYHYTLYYYDQAGNLIKTIPPAGVQQLNITSYNDALSIACQNDRVNHTKTVFSNHRLATRYEYNSLNQLVAQNTPDTDPMNIFEPTLPNGLHPELVTTKIQMVNEAVGYLAGYVVVDNQERGYMYKTNDQGATWSRIYGLAGVDFKDILMTNGSTGYAVGAPGLLFRTQDNGQNWTLQNFWAEMNTGNVRSLNALAFHNNTLVIAGDDGLLVTLNGGTYSIISGIPSAFDFSAATVSGGTFYLTANHTDGYAQIYSFDGTTATLMDSYTPVRMRAIDIHDNKGYMAGDDGRIYVKNDVWNTATERWVMLDATLNGTVQKLVVFDENQMLALVNDRVWRTMDAGATWTQTSNFEFKDLHKSIDGNSAFGIGRSGLIQTMALFVPNAPSNPDAPLNQHIAMLNDNVTATQVWHQIIESGNQSKTLAAYVKANKLYYSTNALVPNAQWQEFTIPLSGAQVADMKLSYFGTYAAPHIKGLILLDNGSILRVSTQATTVVDAGPSGTTYAAISRINQNDFRAVPQSGGARTVTVNNSGTLSQTLSTTVSGLTGSLAIGDVMISNGANNIVLSNLNYRFGMTSNIVFTNITNTTRAAKLHDITTASTNVVAVGNSGIVYLLDNGVWKQQITGSHAHLYAVHTNSGFVYSAGQSGHFVRGTFAGGTYTNNPLNATMNGTVGNAINEDLFGIATHGTRMYAFGQNGRVMYSPDANSQAFAKLSFGVNDLHAGTAIGSNNQVLIVGNTSMMFKASGSAATQENRIHVPALRDLDFSALNVGYVVGDDFTVRRTNNSGISWQSVAPSTLASVASNFDLQLVQTVNYNDAYVLGAAGAARVNPQGIATKISGFPTDIIASDANTAQLVALKDNGTIYRYSIGTSGLTAAGTMTNTSIPLTCVALQGPNNVMAGGTNVFKYFDNTNTAVSYSGATISGNILAIDVKNANAVMVGENGVYYRMKSTGANANGVLQGVNWIAIAGLANEDQIITAPGDANLSTVAIASTTQILYGGQYDPTFISSLTNPVEVPWVRSAFDPGERYSSRFYYDKLGRLIVSENARQYNGDDRKFSYTLYDELGRVIEVGEKTENSDFLFRDVFGSMVSGHYNPRVIDDNKLLAWINGDGIRQEVTRSYYDEFRDDFYTPPFAVNQDNQRKRIAHVAYYSAFPYDDLNNPIAFNEYDHATHFVYDIHGNVTKLMQDNRKMSEEFASLADHRIKTMEYSYDLVSGNVHRMSVQTGEADQWHHAYTYDADNRITEVYTSTQTPLLDISYPSQSLTNELAGNSDWTLEANYFYYAHGTLARTELGNELQGLDYIYNLQGWLKGVNATSLDNALDPGGDGTGSFSKDVMAFSLHYYQGDYTPIGGVALHPACSINYANTTLNTGVGNALNLYNGNIRFMQTTLTDIPTRDALPMLNSYKYDQLNRLLESRSYTDGLSSNIWNPTTYDDKYFNAFTYDANGNILTQKRHNSAGDIWEDLTYHYLVDGSGNLVRNRLYHVRDYAGVTSPMYNNPSGTMSSQMDANNSDLNDQGQFIDASIFEVENDNNYKYDEEGRLIQDLAEGIENIVWRVDGKVKKVIFTSVSTKNNLEFEYDAFGRRIAKHVFDQSNNLVKTTYYLLDASGNLMSVMEHTVVDENTNFTLKERNIYGSSALGLNKHEVDLLSTTSSTFVDGVLGEKFYNLSNHLGNVLTTISDIKVPESSDNISVTSYRATIVNTYDYSPFGVMLDGRTQENEFVRNGFNGMERDDEMKGMGNSYTTEFRMLDPRLGRWLSIDPKMYKYPYQSPYVAFNNNPVYYTDPYGDDPPEKGKQRAEAAKKIEATDTRTYDQVPGDASFKTPEGIATVDCSEFCREVAATQGYDPGRDSRSQASYYQKNGEWTTDVSAIREGDFVFFCGSSGSISHTGVVTKIENGVIYVTQSCVQGAEKQKGGDGKGGVYEGGKKSVVTFKMKADGSCIGLDFVGAGRPSDGTTSGSDPVLTQPSSTSVNNSSSSQNSTSMGRWARDGDERMTLEEINAEKQFIIDNRTFSDEYKTGRTEVLNQLALKFQ
jgi:RHS repeat-associated protein